MYIKRKYGFWMTFNWSRTPFILGALYSAFVTAYHLYINSHIELPWQPLSIMGVAVAFYLGFKNNSSYDRTWEARKIWGSIVNNSRTFGAALAAFVQAPGKPNEIPEVREIIYRHIAWLTALRYQLRLSKEWEHTQNRVNGLYSPAVSEEYFNTLCGELKPYLNDDEVNGYTSKSNIATQILKKQSVRLQELRNQNYYDDFRHMRLHDLMRSFYEDQVKSERIKNFPFPRQYASVATWLNLVFSALLPFGVLSSFSGLDGNWLWSTVPISALTIWVFFLMEKIGDYSENPFEGTYNDIPITNIARTIEIDMREMIDDTDIPKPIQPVDGFLM